MSKPSKNEFLDQLVGDLKPEASHFRPELRFIFWAVFSFCFVALAMEINRPLDIEGYHQVATTQYLIEAVIAFMPFFSLGYLAFLYSVPGRSPSRKWLLIALIPISLYILSTVFGVLFDRPLPEGAMVKGRYLCNVETLVVSLIPIVGMSYLIVRSYAYKKRLVAVLIGLAGGSLPMALMHIYCANDPLHILKHHIGPVLVISTIVLIVLPLVISKFSKE